jgi:hypothetical protein
MSEEESYHDNESVESNMEQKNVEGKGSKKLNQTSSSIKACTFSLYSSKVISPLNNF